MGQAFRRAAGRIRGPGGVEQTPPLKSKTAVDRTPVAEPTGPVRITRVSKPNVDPAGKPHSPFFKFPEFLFPSFLVWLLAKSF